MQIGVISEGKGDFAVIRNVLKGALSLESFDIHSLRPELQADETSLQAKEAKHFSNWELVKEECLSQTTIRTFLENIIEGARIVAIHIDTAECELPNFGVIRPDRTSPTYVEECCQAVEKMMDVWLTGCDLSLLVKAIAVEETEAWILPLHDAELIKKTPETGSIPNPKERLEKLLNRPNTFSEKERKKLFQKDTLSKYTELSTELQRPKGLLAAMKSNTSLQLFVESLCRTVESIEPGLCRILGR